MNRKLCALLLAGALSIGLLTGCGGNTEPQDRRRKARRGMNSYLSTTAISET